MMPGQKIDVCYPVALTWRMIAVINLYSDFHYFNLFCLYLPAYDKDWDVRTSEFKYFLIQFSVKAWYLGSVFSCDVNNRFYRN